MKKVLFSIIIILCSLISCNLNKLDEYPQIQKSEKFELIIASEKVPAIAFDACTGTDFEVNAFAVKENKNDDWKAFTNSIKGFNHVVGTEYQLQIRKEKLFDPRRSVQYWEEYTLTEIISQEKRKSENLPKTFIE